MSAAASACVATEVAPLARVQRGPADASRPLSVLIVHNAYQQRGGEEAVVEAEAAMLQAQGHPVQRYERHNDEVPGRNAIALLQDTVWSRRSHAAMVDAIDRHRPDVIHVHNTFPLISPSVYWAAHRAGVPVVQTVHNFRLICPQAMLLRAGKVCEDCVGRSPWRAVRHRCYRNSATQSAAVALSLQTHRTLGTWRDKVARYIALTEFCRDKLIEGGLPAGRIRVKPNFLDQPAPTAGPRDGFVFVGRLSPEKGVDVLSQAMKRLSGPPSLRVVGTGPASETLAATPGVTMLGALQPEAVYREMREATALVLPSIWFEGLPRTLVEAYAQGLPVIASRLGALAQLVVDGQTGLFFTAGDPAELAHRMQWMAAHPEEARRMGRQARLHFEKFYDSRTNYQALMRIYAEARALAPGLSTTR